MKGYKVMVYGPETTLQEILRGVAHLRLGQLGNYDSWSIISPVTESFRPLEGSQPTHGKAGELQQVASCRLELQCKENELGKLLDQIRELHPYETPAIEVLELILPAFD